jgi:pre-mRNA-splicing factor CWC26
MKGKKKKKKKKKDKKELERRWKGVAPPNRFNILPGHLWDGVDRSNGFEIKFLQRESNQIAKTEQAYLWSVEDM